MKEHPILFAGPMVRAILDGRKTMTRRVIKPQPQLINGMLEYESKHAVGGCSVFRTNDVGFMKEHLRKARCPYGVPGDRLWVRETYADPEGLRLPVYRADEATAFTGIRWTPSIHMPRWASRITLEITDMKIERIQNISEEDADKEGFAGDFPSRVFPEIFTGSIDYYGQFSIPECFGILWDSLNAKRGYGWDANPFVWVVSFAVK